MEIVSLRTEYLRNPIGIDAISPRLGWKITSERTDVMQSAYQVQAAESPDFHSILWDSGRVETDRSQGVSYGGPGLSSMERVYWRVRIWDNLGQISDYSEPAFFEMGLLSVSDWHAKWTEPEAETDPDAYKPAPYLRREFTVKTGLVSARAYLSAKGLYTFSINGKPGTDHLFTPGFTVYHKRIQYQAYDITDLLAEGANTLGVILGDGWWRGSTGVRSLKNNFGYKLAFLGQLVLTYADGSQEIVGGGEAFKATTGPILKSDMKAGEIYDARLAMEGWDTPGYDDTDWHSVTATGDSLDILIATRSVPVKGMERFTPAVITTPDGETVLDFGQNIAGFVSFQVQGPAGTEVSMLHSETLDKDGNFTLDYLDFMGPMTDFQEIHYVLKGEGVETYTPHFAIFGFRYVLLKDYPGEAKPENFTAIAVYSVMEETGSFSCSHSLINQLVENARWSQKGNFMEIPTDCPTRERAGWTGDAQLYCRTASDLMHVYPFFEKWMADLTLEQYPSGKVGNTVPDAMLHHNPQEAKRLSGKGSDLPGMEPTEEGSIMDGSAGWGDASVIIPWTLYLCYGDKTILERQYDSAKAWVDYMDRCAKDANENYKDTPAYHTRTGGELDADYIWDTRYHWGEWLEADRGPFGSENEESIQGFEMMQKMLAHRLKYSDPLVATAYYAYSTRLFSEIAGILERTEDAATYLTRYKKIKAVYNRYFVKADGVIDTDRQAPNVRTLAFGLADSDTAKPVAERLARIVKEKSYHLNTGFLSTPFLLPVLVDSGYVDTAFRLLEQETAPSWLYAVSKGATTIWEEWNGMAPDGSISSSLNHYSYGAVCDFLFAYVAGIRPVMDTPGYKAFLIKPLPGGSLTRAKGRYESLYGTIESAWEINQDGTRYSFTVPPNTTASVMLPGTESDLSKIQKQFEDACYQDGRIVFAVGSGRYETVIWDMKA